jgi:RHS repeat-associated protein
VLFFQSHLWDADAGLLHMKARVLDPSTGHFLQRDPVPYVDALNLYAGFGWDPVNMRDPTGMLGAHDSLFFGLPDEQRAQVAQEHVSGAPAYLGVGVGVGYAVGMAPVAAVEVPALVWSWWLGGGAVNATCFGSGILSEDPGLDLCPVLPSDELGRATGQVGRRLLRNYENWGEGGAESVEAAFRMFDQPLTKAAKGAGTALKDFSSVATRTTRGGGQGVRLTRPDGSVLDITGKRVKEFVPNTHPNAPPGTLQRVQVPNAQPGTKGFKRDPTPDELRLLEEVFK